MNRKVYTKTSSSPLAPSTGHTAVNMTTDLHCSSVRAAAAEEGKENVMYGVVADMETTTCSKSWWVKVCNRIRKHFLCQDCRASSHNMKTMYHQLCRNLSLREHSRTTTCTSGDLSSPASSRGGGLSRSKSMKVGRPTSPESGYETATSVESSCSVGRLSEEGPASTSSRECGGSGGGCGLAPGLTSCLPAHHLQQGESGQPATDDHLCSKDRAEVFGGAFQSEKAHLLRHLQQGKSPQRIYSRHPAPAAPSAQDSHHPAKTTMATKQYDGYLEIRTPNSRSVKYVFKKPEGGLDVGEHSADLGGKKKGGKGVGKDSCEDGKECYRCHKVRSVAFRAPFGHGWLCENCMDDLM